MHRTDDPRLRVGRTRALALALLLGLPLAPGALRTAAASPPDWAPAHGYREKHHDEDHRYEHEREREHERHRHHREHQAVVVVPQRVGIAQGQCHRDVIGGLLGAAAGGAAGSQIGSGNGRLAATAAGAVLGFLIGSSVGHSMDSIDQYCLGSALEDAPDQRPVEWTNPSAGTRYRVVPMDTFESNGRYCREYVADATINGRLQRVRGTACRQPDGSWKTIN